MSRVSPQRNMSAISNGEYSVEVDVPPTRVIFRRNEEVLRIIPARPDYSYYWLGDSNGEMTAFAALDGTSLKEVIWPMRENRFVLGVP